MKKRFNIPLTLLLMSVIALTSCNQVKLDDQDAKNLVIGTLDLPQKFTEKVDVDVFTSDGLAAERFYKLEDAGFIYKQEYWSYGKNFYIYCTDKGKPYLVGEDKENMQGKKTLRFQAFDIYFDQITGIAINKEQQTATVRFSLKATNISPIGRALEKNIDNPRNWELVYKKFDNGWQLASDHNESGIDLLRKIWWPQD